MLSVPVRATIVAIAALLSTSAFAQTMESKAQTQLAVEQATYTTKLAAAEAAYNARHYQQAIHRFTPLIQRYPKRFRPYLQRGLAYYYLDQYAPAITDANRYIALRPNLYDGYLLRAYAYKGYGKYQEALADLDIVDKLDPANKRDRFSPASELRAEIETAMNRQGH